jgi:hypothetical protein
MRSQLRIRYWLFRKIWNQKWSKVLSFRQPSDFSQCSTCWKAKKAINAIRVTSCAELEEKFAAHSAYKQHLNIVFNDRQVSWMARDMAMASQGSDAFVIFTDGMDQAKARLPRDPMLRSMKDVAQFQRPQCVVQIVWVIGVRLDLYILDCDQAHDSSSIIQCVSTTLEHIAVDFASRNRMMPSALFLWVPGLANPKP